MPSKPSLLFMLTFVAISLLEMIGDTLPITWLHYGCKPLIMGLLFWYSWKQYRTIGYKSPARWLMIGMVFALLGDVFLMIRELDLFAPGLGAFLVMQLCYSRAFWLSRQQHQAATNRWTWSYALPFVVYLGIFLAVLHPTFSQNPALKPLWWPVVLYAICLNTMGFLATQRQGLQGYRWVMIGALLFILSDSLIAIDKFLMPISGSTWLVMSTYATAQYLIVIGIL
ncbi:lysoplasmalogenase [Spirosoma sp. HMF3257]|uniref:Lysoplasmalogenase n=2 Tax=Spirosoma telluris TaxID=2183553 RepID=A0A327NT78_9BACT|nr:lysoplasmalogenase [Spirosoma telluris]RAI77783.1 lysoplasmalogenase [Spirosoma telluris]